MGLDRVLRKLDRLLSRGEHARAKAVYEALLRKAECHSNGDSARLALVGGRLLAREGKYDDAVAVGRRVLRTLKRTIDPNLLAWCHLLLSGWLLRTGDYEASIKHAEAGIYLCRWEIRNGGVEGDLFNNLGLAQKNMGLWDEAERSMKRALGAYPHSGGAGPNLRSASNLAILLRKKGKASEAASICREGLHLCERSGLPLLECRYALELGNISVIMREHDVGHRHIMRASRIAESHSYTRELILVKEVEGDLASLLGRFEDARKTYEDALGQVARLMPLADLESELLHRVALMCLRTGRTSEARQYSQRAIDLTGDLSDKYESAICLRVLGQTEIEEGLTASGLDHLRESVRVLSSLSLRAPGLALSEYTLGCAILSCREEREWDEALINLLGARRIYSILGVGEAIREVDVVVSSVMSSKRPFRRAAVADTTHSTTGRATARDLGRYGIVTADDRILGDVCHWGSTDVRILIEGETGVGKELVARTLHALGRRREHRFVAVDCGALSETLADSELFGHIRGSFTGAFRDRVGLIEEADGGTLLLDEVGELSEAVQAKLLRVLEEGEVRRVGDNKVRRIDIRVISATTKDLGQAVETGRFRRDLYYRLKGALIRIPSLRERRGDIDLLLYHFLGLEGERCGRDIRLSDGARERLCEYSWPGNVRELKSTLEALAVSVGEDGEISAGLVERFMPGLGRGSGLDGRVKAIEHEEIERALSACNGNKSKAARMLGIARRTLYSKIKKDR